MRIYITSFVPAVAPEIITLCRDTCCTDVKQSPKGELFSLEIVVQPQDPKVLPCYQAVLLETKIPKTSSVFEALRKVILRPRKIVPHSRENQGLRFGFINIPLGV